MDNPGGLVHAVTVCGSSCVLTDKLTNQSKELWWAILESNQ
jgi:hypothetical protein